MELEPVEVVPVEDGASEGLLFALVLLVAFVVVVEVDILVAAVLVVDVDELEDFPTTADEPVLPTTLAPASDPKSAPGTKDVA